MADYIVQFVVDRLGNALLNEVKCLQEFDEQFRNIKTQLSWMRSFLQDAYRKKDADERVKNWILQVRDLAYDVEDIVEYVRLRSKSSDRRWAIWNSTGFWKRSVSSRLNGISSRITRMTTDLQTYGISSLEGPSNTSSSMADRRQLFRTHSHVPVNNVVGLDEDIETLVAKLVGVDSNGTPIRERRVISICGMGGLGKTTLAKKVYNHPRIKDCFPCRAWVYISREWGGREREILEVILFKLISPSYKQREEIKKLEYGDVARMLYEELQLKRCLVVFDDIWEAEIWKILSPGFPAEGTASKIILTTRNREVGIQVDPRCYIHELKLLKDEDSLELFHRIAISQRDDTDITTSYESFTKLGKEMVRHCGGLPLAVIVLGGLLATKQTIHEWDRVHENIKSYLRGCGKDSFGVLEVLALSYHDLPQRLKPCFLYLARFPEDYHIQAKKLMNLWVAEGFVPTAPDEEGEETMENIAYGYLEELAQRYIVIVEEQSNFGWIKTCSMHDLMRDLCLSEAKKDEFLTRINVTKQNEQVGFLSSAMLNRGAENCKTRRISISCSIHVDEHVPPGDTGLSSIRSLSGFALDPDSGMFGEKLFNSIAREFKFARVVDLENIRCYGNSKNIKKLLYLRLLDVRCAWIGELSSSLGELCFLETLYLSREPLASKDPDVFQRMKLLRHLYLPPTCSEMTRKLRFANLCHLQTLVNFPTSCADIKDLLTLPNLRKLVAVVENEDSLSKFTKLFNPSKVHFRHLKSISIQSDNYYTVRYMTEIGEEAFRKILSCCPRLQRFKLADWVVYLKPVSGDGGAPSVPNFERLVLERVQVKNYTRPNIR